MYVRVRVCRITGTKRANVRNVRKLSGCNFDVRSPSVTDLGLVISATCALRSRSSVCLHCTMCARSSYSSVSLARVRSPVALPREERDCVARSALLARSIVRPRFKFVVIESVRAAQLVDRG